MKERLTAYRHLMVEIDIAERMRDAIDPEAGFSARRARHAIERRLEKMLEEECREHDALTAIIDALPDAEQRQVLYARYVAGRAWCGVAHVVFGRHPDFYEKEDSYLRRIYRIHGNALANANRKAEEAKRATRRPAKTSKGMRGCIRRSRSRKRVKRRFRAR